MFVFTDEAEKKIDKIMAKYPPEHKRSAILPLLHLAQDQEGYVTPEAMVEVGRRLDVSPAYVEGVVTFYTMYFTKPVGRNVIRFCHNISCKLNRSDELMQYTAKKLGIQIGETTPDKRFTLLKEECLAACSEAPMMMVNKTYHVNLNETKIDQILETYK
ncbi:NADH-quinone oxidoreductase subunit NuoE [Nitrospina sp. 32_T5]|uniref:NADH-quinone oxidoreductase subunit NuoE n=1 Tax=unclassified Nitrospina TaxID=2638683 RepID=UPI003F97FB2E